ncbi:MAG: hypothetical protein CVV22_06580 [Ignavibacteriae bacterium HGW-Ignavibacteriae-1]|jgi:tetratricopeptide (TPR) repeat protein|nr:MAG: hypothetical protein CVV22_06580 [Ignavibacteriae bacterium HGW-Ignavibacteriae-1]
MKQSIIYLIFSLLILSFSPFDAISQGTPFEKGKRDIKLGITYREAGDFVNAKKFIDMGLNLVDINNSFDSRYWTAVGYEYLGYVYRDNGQKAKADDYFRFARDIYRRIISQSDGSQVAIDKVIANLDVVLTQEVTPGPSWKVVAPSVERGTIMNVTNKKLSTLPQDMPDNLTSIVLAKNKFVEFPSGLDDYENLEYLDLSDNRIQRITSAIGKLTQLHYLDMSYNRLAEIDKDIAKLQNLRELNLSNNRLKIIPASLCELKGLRLLNLEGNSLSYEDVMNLVRCLPGTNIKFDEYEKVEETVGFE